MGIGDESGMSYELFPYHRAVAVLERVVLLCFMHLLCQSSSVDVLFFLDTTLWQVFATVYGVWSAAYLDAVCAASVFFLFACFPLLVFLVRRIFIFLSIFLHAFCMGIGSPGPPRVHTAHPVAQTPHLHYLLQV